MNSIEQQFADALQADPENWDLRLNLADRLIQRGEVTGSRTVISSGPVPPVSVEQMARALAFFGGKPKGGNWGPMLQQYLTQQRTDARAHLAYAHMLAMVGSLDGARQHYTTAVSIDHSLVDPNLRDALGISPEPTPGADLSPVPPKKTVQDPVPAKQATVIEPVAPRKEKPVEEEISEELAPAAETAPEPEAEPQPEPDPTPEIPTSEEPVSEPEPQTAAAETEAELEKQETTTAEESREQKTVSKEDTAKDPAPEKQEQETGDEEDSTEKSGKALVTAEGEAPKAAEKESDRNDRRTALIAAGVIHLILLVLFAIWSVSQPPQAPPQIVTRAPQSEQEDRKQVEKKKIQNEASLASDMQIVTANSASALALPDLSDPNQAFDIVGMDNGLGPSMDFGGGSKGGTVSFFGSRSSGKKVVFVIDASASMKQQGDSGKTRFELMKEELKKSVGALPSGVSYQIIFFAGPAWFAGSPVDRENWHDKNGRNHWYYKTGELSELPREKLLRASPGRIQATMKDIDSTNMVFGTDWRSPLKMAMNLKPDLIFFMTDGFVTEDPETTPVVEDVLTYNKNQSKAKINCICLMELKAFEMMEQLSKGTGGDFSLVLENGDVLRGREVERIAAQNK